MSGTWWVGTGIEWDPEQKMAPVKPGTYATHFARQVHYDGSRKGDPEPAVELVWGMGPVVTVVCNGANAEKGPGPCEDARNAAARAKYDGLEPLSNRPQPAGCFVIGAFLLAGLCAHRVD